MSEITINRNYKTDTLVVVFDKKALKDIELLKYAIKILSREVVKYEHGIDIDITRNFTGDEL